MLSGGGACIAGARPPPAEAAPPLLLGSKARFLRLVRGRLAATYMDLSCSATSSPFPVTDPEHSEPGGAGVRGRALSGGSPRGARGAGAGPGREVQEVRGSNPAGVTTLHLLHFESSKKKDSKPK